ncbi:DUF6612 family protein [Paenibacillus sp. SI8]|uniref:DUF6612 family protein n=1 Tax=unclassified Paenibacillus TaxID=185978 RepID=UPI003465237E
MIRIKRTSLLTALGLTLIAPAFAATTAFADTAPVTRGQFIKLIAEELKLAPVNKQSKLPSDVKADSPYADAVRVMQERKTMEGYSDGKYRLDQPISKEEAGYILGRFLGILDSRSSSKLQELFGADFGKDAGINEETAAALIKQSLANDPSVSKWLAEASKTQVELATFRANMDMTIHIAFKPGQGGYSDNLETTAISNIEYNKDQGIHQVITTTTPGSDSKERTIKIEQYTVTQGTYMNMPNGDNTGFEWYDMTKQMPFTFDQLMALQKQSTQINQTLITPYFFYKDLGTTEMDGKKLHKVQVRGKITNTSDIIKTLGGLGSGDNMFKDLLDSPALADMSVALSAEITLDEQSKLPVSMDGDYTVTYGNEPSNPIDYMDMSMTMSYKDINQPISIALPDAAKKAKPFSMPTAVPTAPAAK